MGTKPWQLFEFVDPWEVWGEGLRVELAGADQSGIVSTLTDVCDYFLKASAALRAEMFYDIKVGVTDFPINEVFKQPNLVALLVHRVCLDGRWRSPCLPPSQLLQQPASRPAWAYLVHPQILRIAPAAKVDMPRGLGVLLSFNLERPITCVPKYLAEHHYEAIQEGVLYRMKGHTKRQYSDREASMLHRRTYQHHLAEARDLARRRWGNAESPKPFNPLWSQNARSGVFMR